MYGKTREEAVLILLGLREHVSLFVQHRRPGLFHICIFKLHFEATQMYSQHVCDEPISFNIC